MSWESFEWRPVDAETPQGTAALADLVPMARSATEEAVSAVVMGSITAVGLSVTSVTGRDLPAGFTPAATFELLGTPRRGVWVALDPAFGARLAGADVTATGLAPAIIEAFDAVLAETVGEGLSSTPTDTLEIDPAAELVLFRLVLRDGDGTEAAFVTAVEAMVPVELATHVVALQALGPAAPSPQPAKAAAATPPPTVTPATVDATPASPAAAPTAGVAQARATSAIRPFVLDELPPAAATATTQNIELLMGVHLEVTVEIGRTRLAIRDVLSLSPGSIVELDKLAGEKVDVLVNGQPIAQGEVVVVDENFGVRITDVVSRQRRILSADGAA
jgi:flagellar motor switch protein FliN